MAKSEHDFEQLLETYAQIVSHAIQKVCFPKFRDYVEDIRQEVHIKLWDLLKSGKKMEAPESYIYRVAFTTALRFVQKRGGWVSTDELNHPLKANENDSKSDRKMTLEKLMSRLDDEHRRALKAYMVGFNHKEVASIFGWSEPKARHLVYRGIQSLKELEQ